MSGGFDTIAMVDWSGGRDRGLRPKKDAIWMAVLGEAHGAATVYLRNRQLAEAVLAELIAGERAAGRRLMIGFDFPFGYPAGFAAALTGRADPFAVWDWLAGRVEDAPNSDNRFALAGQINRALGQGAGPFWGRPASMPVPGLATNKAGYRNPFPERRACEARAQGAFTCWQLAYAGAVGSQMIMGLPVLDRLCRRFAGQVAVWPFEPPDRPVTFVEIWPSLIRDAVARKLERDKIKDRAQVRVMARAAARLQAEGGLAALLADVPEGAPRQEEGWILGLGHEAALDRAAG